jgi:hypothetical protein
MTPPPNEIVPYTVAKVEPLFIDRKEANSTL